MTGPDVDREARRVLVTGRTDLDGIDFIEVVANRGGTPGHVDGAPAQRTLLVYLLNGAVPPDWDRDRVSISGGVRPDPRINPVGVEWAYPALAVAGAAQHDDMPTLPPGVSGDDQKLVNQALPNARAVRERALVVRTTTSGDWSPYTLELTGEADLGGGRRLDEPLRQGSFSFTVDCPSDLDCAAAPAPAPPALPSTVPHYLARDADALLTRLTDRFAALLPGWTDRNPADPAVMLHELFAYLGDRLAYWQDAIAVEAYLGTARRRTSVRRHARLLNYAVHEGCSARTLLALTTDSDLVLPASTPVTDLVPDPREGATLSPGDAADLGGTVFETCVAVPLSPERNALPLYAWGDADHCLLPGTTAAFVSTPSGVDPSLQAGDLLLLVDQPVNGVPRQGDPARRYAVRLVADARHHDDPLDPSVDVWELRWGPADALTGSLQVSTPGTSDARAVALANLVVADHGATLVEEQLVPPSVADDGEFHPRLARTGLSFTDPDLPTSSAAALLDPDPRQARAALSLYDGQRTWLPQPDLLASGRLAAHVVVEPEPGGVSRLRFGDGVNGRAPAVRATPLATYRIGGGSAGNLAPDRLVRLLELADGRSPVGAGVVVSVWNPLPAVGGTDPELLEQVRQLAPSAFRQQLRAVTSPDYAAVADLDPGVQRAVARRRWTGSWYAEEVTVDPVAARADDATLVDGIAAVLEIRRMAGIDVEFERPVYVPLHVELRGCVRPDYLRADVEAGLRDVFSSRRLPDGSLGFFHPDHFTFGQPLRLSSVVAAAMSVEGMAWAELSHFSRMGASARDAAATLADGEIPMAPREVLRCDSDVNNPESGRLDLSLGGGS